MLLIRFVVGLFNCWLIEFVAVSVGGKPTRKVFLEACGKDWCVCVVCGQTVFKYKRFKSKLTLAVSCKHEQ